MSQSPRSSDPFFTRIVFPDPEEADVDGLLAVGGDLMPGTLLQAYARGIFPWSVQPITWWSPDPRAVFEIDQFKVSRRLTRVIRQGRFRITFDAAFPEVMKHCSRSAPGREETWISPEFVKAYSKLHQLGFAHSAEAWLDERLVGGVYGVSIGGFFAGESMFHLETDAGKVALAALMARLRERGYRLFDSQQANPATRNLGVVEIPRPDYLERLRDAIALPVTFGPVEKADRNSP